jgi:hypothetical protein
VNIGSLDGPQRSVVLRADTRAAYAAPGNLLFVRQGTLLSQKFDAAALRLSGEPIPVAEGVLSSLATGSAGFTASTTGVLVYRTGPGASSDRLAWFSRTGQAVGTLAEPGDYQNPRLSPDGRQLAVRRRTTASNAGDIWILDLDRGTSARLTAAPLSGQQPVWSPDGSRIAYSVGRPGPTTLFQKLASGIAAEEVLSKSDVGASPDDWTPDGRGLLYHQGVGQPPTSLMLLTLDADRKPRPVVDSRFVAIDGRFSADGKWLAYVSTESGRPEVYLQNFPTATAKWPISASGGTQPVWRRDGRELFYLAPDGMLMAVSLSLRNDPEISAPRLLFQTHVVGGSTMIGGGMHHQYDVTPDGQRFLILTAGDADESPFNVVVNWPAALKK